jgi:predicted metal-dependent peptidase
MAMDFVINAKLIEDNEDGFATMTGELTKGCYDPKYKGWDTARVFHDLKKNGNVGMGHTKSGDVLDKHDWDNAKTMTPDEKEQLAREIDQAIRQGAMVAGKMGSGGDRDIDELLRPQVDWRQILREFITETCAGRDYSSWRKPNRRYISMGIYMPSGVSEKVEELVIAVDTSGSIGSRELSVFLSEVKSIAETVKPSAVHILYWDTEVCRAEKYEMHELDNLINSTKPEGGGGTMIECVPQYMADNNVSPQACIILTDGYLGGSWGQWTCPTLWCVLDNKSAKPDVGKVVHVKSDFM